MVDVVDAMIGFGPASFEARASASRLRSSTSGTPSKMIEADDSAACACASGTTDTRAISVSTAARIEQAEACERGEHVAHFVQRVVRQLFERRFVARLEIDQRDLVPRIGEHDRDAAPHAPRAEAGDGFSHCRPSASIFCNAARSRPPRPSDCSVRPVRMKSSPQIAPPIDRNARASGVGTPASSPHRDEKRQPDAHVLQHVAMLRQHDVLAPVAASR